jgi:hypothetical protein
MLSEDILPSLCIGKASDFSRKDPMEKALAPVVVMIDGVATRSTIFADSRQYMANGWRAMPSYQYKGLE